MGLMITPLEMPFLAPRPMIEGSPIYIGGIPGPRPALDNVVAVRIQDRTVEYGPAVEVPTGLYEWPGQWQVLSGLGGLLLWRHDGGGKPVVSSYTFDRSALTWTPAATADVPVFPDSYWAGTSGDYSSATYTSVVHADEDGHLFAWANKVTAPSRVDAYRGAVDADGAFDAFSFLARSDVSPEHPYFIAIDNVPRNLAPHKVFSTDGWIVDFLDPDHQIPDGASGAYVYLLIDLPGPDGYKVGTNDRRWRQDGHGFYLFTSTLLDSSGNYVPHHENPDEGYHVLVKGHIDPATGLDVVEDWKIIDAPGSESYYAQWTTLPSGKIVGIWRTYLDPWKWDNWTGLHVVWDFLGDRRDFDIHTNELPTPSDPDNDLPGWEWTQGATLRCVPGSEAVIAQGINTPRAGLPINLYIELGPSIDGQHLGDRRRFWEG